MRLNLTTNLAAQAAAAIGQLAAAQVPDDRLEKWLALAITIAQAFIAIAAHFRRPDGRHLNPSGPEPQQPPAAPL